MSASLFVLLVHRILADRAGGASKIASVDM